MKDVMLDLETMGTGADAAIVAIGAFPFDAIAEEYDRGFYRVVDLQSSVDCGGTITPSTVMWWLKQSEDARFELGAGAEHIAVVLQEFSQWCTNICPREELRMWGNGAAFDNVILASAYQRNNTQAPWLHWNDRCYRTIKNLRPDIKMERLGTHHNARDDAQSQAWHITKILHAIGSPL